VTIRKAKAVFTAPTVNTLTYTGEAQALVEAGTATSGTMWYSLDGKNRGTVVPTAVDAGSYIVRYRVIGDANHKNSTTETLTVVIGKAENEFTAPTPKLLTYTGRALPLIEEGTAAFGTMQYSLDGENYSETIPTAIDGGNYTVYYKVVGDANHKDVEPQTVTAVIGYSVTVAWSNRDTVSADTVIARNGQIVRLILTPAFGTGADKLSVKQGGNDVLVLKNRFLMPKGNVTVSATFRELTVFTVPAALTEIGEEAFAGIAAECVQISDNVVNIGSRAFADCASLQQIAIPASVQTIADDALAGANVTVYGQAGTEAERFAEANGFGFVDTNAQ